MRALYDNNIRVIRNDCNTWEALSYLEEMTLELYYLDFKFHYNRYELPDDIVFMTHGMF